MWALTSESALAERADRDKPINIESDSMISDGAKKVSTFEGKVVLVQGSLIIRADRIVVRQDGDVPPQAGRLRRIHRRRSVQDRIR